MPVVADAAVFYPDATALAVVVIADGITAQGESWPVRAKVPNPRPDQFVTVTRTGGPRLNLVADQAQITVDSWALIDEEAHDLAQLCRALLHGAASTVVSDSPIYRVTELSGPGYLPDPDSDQSRYRQSFTLSARGAVLTVPVASS